MEKKSMECIADRLSSMDSLYFPGAGILTQPPSASQRKSALFDLLSRDPSIFLQRYGPELNPVELASFDPLRSDYEVDWYVARLRRTLLPSPADSRANSAAVRNRRRAHMERMMRGGGDYFSEDCMREREPYLHHEYVGRFQDRVGRVLSRPGERWSETLMRRCEEEVMMEKIRGEQRRLGVDRKDWVGGEEEEGNEVLRSLEAQEDDTNDNVQESAEPPKTALSTEEMQDQLDQFTYVMQQKFLAGEDNEHLDYSAIDNDEGLDDHWIKEANHDAEEKYFDED